MSRADEAVNLTPRPGNPPDFEAIGHSRLPRVNPIVIGFTGYKQHGKDTSGSVLIRKHGFKRVSFADGLKQCLAVVLRIPVDMFENEAFKASVHHESGLTYRQWLQQIGTEGFRSRWEDVWANWALQEIKEKGYQKVVMTDLRFPNEVAAVRKWGFENSLIRIHNPRKVASGDTHASEAHVETLEVDQMILNDDTVETLEARVESYVLARHPGVW